MKTLGKIALAFFIGFIGLLIAGTIVLSATGTFGQLWQAMNGRPYYGEYSSDSFGSELPIDENKMHYSDSQQLSLEGVETIVVEANACQLQALQEEDAKELFAGFQSGALFGDDYARMTIETEGDKLYIKIKQDVQWRRWFESWEEPSFSKLNLRIPASYQGKIQWDLNACDAQISDFNLLAEMDISLNAGKLALSRVQVGELEVDGNAADTTLKDIKVESEADFSCAAGSLYGDLITAREISVNNDAGETTLERIQGAVESDCTVGSVILSFAQVTGNIDVRASTGSTELIFPKESPIRLKVTGNAHVQDHMVWTGGQYEMRDYQYTVTASGNTSKLVLREQ